MAQKSARMMALEVLYTVLEEGAYSNISLNRVLEKYRPEKLDRAFATELVYGTLRTLGTLDWILAKFLKKPLTDLPTWIRTILRMGVYQIIYMDRVPDSAACNESANLARKYGHTGTVKLVNGVLRNVARNREEIKFPDIDTDPVRGIAVRYSHPEWLVRKWVREFGAQGAEELCRANNEVPPNAVRTNTLRITRDELKETLAEEGVESIEGRFAPETLIIGGFKSVGSLAAHRSGLFMVQDESSALVGHALSPQPGSLVIDACSAPGGKSTHLAQLMGNRGHIISADVHPHKMRLIRENAARLGVDIIEPVVVDAAEIDREYPGKADYILVDAPCSGLGILRRRPEIRWRKEPGQINELAALQLKILQSASRCLKPGGTVVYSTCTLTGEENIDVVKKFLADNEDFAMESLADYLPGPLAELPGTDTIDRGYIQFLPHIHGTDGFFIARMKKKG
ncbi:MAG: 16S rRNA (cytosine(967)-C(5))-methyltransferase RsmB [Firmicutes bacterium HGW-Firmicutes-14]|nr:MAG: 16S rRNA (cytosine(967)-C(5))-methyltransferase RsmB [Firmicutes bacterium HGW-Firmicutes-14]